MRDGAVTARRLLPCLLATGLLPAVAGAEALSFGASLREKIEHVSDNRLGAGGETDTVFQHRLLGHADWRPQASLRAFVQLGAYAQNGRNDGPSPVDDSAPDLHQGFLVWRPRSDLRITAGRQEWLLGSGRLLALRDGPNIRRAFDGLDVEAGLGAATLRVLAGRPVLNRDGDFDDRGHPAQRLTAMQLTRPLSKTLQLELYALDYTRDNARFASGSGNEERQSWGTRLHGGHGALTLNSEAVWQTGRWQDERIRAWTVANDIGWHLPRLPWQPRLGLKADLASGDGTPGDGRLNTFNALYPNPSYFSDAGFIAPANLIDVQPGLTLTPRADISFQAGWNLLWKHRREDAVYTSPVPLNPIAGTAGSDRFIGQQLQLAGTWQASDMLRLQASYVRFQPGAALDGLQDDGIDYLQTAITLTF